MGTPILRDSRALRERERYHTGLQRQTYDRLFLHASLLYAERHDRLRNEALRQAHGGRVLELGSQIWRPWLADQGIAPASLQCINVSESEHAAGVSTARRMQWRPLGLEDLRRFAERFESRFHFEQLLCIPAAALSSLLFRGPDNPLVRAAYRADVALDRLVPALGPLSR